MSRNLARALAFAVAFAAAAPGQSFTLSQSANSTPAPLGSSACGPNPLTYTVANSYFRSYSLQGIGGNVEIVSVTFGVQTVVANQPGGYPVTIRIFHDPTPGTIAPYSGLVLRHTEHFTVPSTATPTVITRPLSGLTTLLAPTETLVIEVAADDGTYTGSKFLMGQNSAGQTAPGYIRAPACATVPNLTDVTDLASVGFGTMHIIIDVNCAVQQPITFAGTNEDLILLSGVNSTILTGGSANIVKTATAGNAVTMQILSPNGGFALRELALLAQPFPTGVPPFPPAAPNIHLQFPGMFFLIGGIPGPFGPTLLAPGGTSMSFSVPPGLSGISVLFQGAVITTFAPFAANGLYVSTDAHEIQVL